MYRKRLVASALLVLFLVSVATGSPIATSVIAAPLADDAGDTCAGAVPLPPFRDWYGGTGEFQFDSPTDADWFEFTGYGPKAKVQVYADGEGPVLLEVYAPDCTTLLASGTNSAAVEGATGQLFLKATAIGGWTGSYWPYGASPDDVWWKTCATIHVYRTGTQRGLANATLELWEIGYLTPFERLVASHVTGPDGTWRYCTYRSWYADHSWYHIREIDPPGAVSTGAEGGDQVMGPNYVFSQFVPGDDITVTFYDTPPITMSLSPADGTSCVGSVQPFVATVADMESAARVTAVEYVLDAGSWLVDAVYLRYDHAANLMYLRDDANTGWLGGYAPGSGEMLENSRARLHLAQSAATLSADNKTLNVTWAVEFKSAFAGTYNQFLYAERGSGFYLGFDDVGDWTVDYCGSPTPTATPTATPPRWECGTHVLQQGVDGYTGSQDVGISSWHPDQNYDGGTNDVMAVRSGDQLAGLIRFDVSMLPPGATVTQATLSLYAARWHEPAPPEGRTLTVRAYEVYRPWLASEATWNLASNGVPWGAPGVNDTTTDRAAQAAASVLVDSVGRWYDLDVTSLVQKWGDEPATNQGIVLKGEGSGIGVELVTMEHGNIALHPKLTIHCELPETPTPTITWTATATSTPETPTPTATWTPTLTPTATTTPETPRPLYLPLLLK